MTTSTLTVRPTLPHVFRGLLARDARVMRRDLVGLAARTLVQPVLFTFVFAYVIPKISGRGMTFGGGVRFSTVLVPGLVASTAMLNGLTSVTLGLMGEISYTREIEDRLLVPAPAWLLGVEKLAWGTAHSLFAGLVVFPVTWLVHASGEAPQLRVGDPAALAVTLLFTPLLAASIGLLLGTILDGGKFNVLITVIMVPATLLGCVYYPWAALRAIPWLQALVLVNPIVYASEGLRAGLVPGVAHLPDAVVFPVLTLGTLLLAVAGVISFTRRVVP